MIAVKIGVKLFPRAYSRSLAFNLTVLGLALLYAFIMGVLLFYRNRYLMDGYAYNLVPFKTIEQYLVHRNHFNFNTWFKNLAGNVVLFIPIGVILPLLNTRFLSSFRLIAACALLIFVVEAMQMILRVGSFDVDDIILNTAGAWLGLLLTKLVLKKGRARIE